MVVILPHLVFPGQINKYTFFTKFNLKTDFSTLKMKSIHFRQILPLHRNSVKYFSAFHFRDDSAAATVTLLATIAPLIFLLVLC